MKIFILGTISLLLSACVTTGSYMISAYDKNGMELNSNLAFTAEGSGIYSVRNAICISHPGAIVKITDIKTGKELEGESPYQCSGKPKTFEHSFKPSNQIEFLNLKYKQRYKKVLESDAVYEFTANNESINKWMSLVSIFYNKNIKGNPEEWVSLSNSQAVKPFDTYVSGDNAYAQIIFKPSNEHHYFETAVKKTFHIEKCDGLVTYIYAKKYPATEKMESIINENKEILKSLEMNTWVPICNED